MNDDWNSDTPRWLTRLSQFLADVAGAVLIAMMGITVYDIVARSLGFGSVEPVVELTTMGVVIVAAFAVGITTIRGGHVIIDLFTRGNKRRTNRLIDSVWLVVMAVFLAMIAYLSVEEGLLLHRDFITTEVLLWSVLVYHLPPALGWGLGAVVCLWVGLAVLRRRGDDPAPQSENPERNQGLTREEDQ